MTTDTEQTLLELTEALSAASERSDADTLNKWIADDFVAVGGKRTSNKAEVVAMWSADDGTITDASHEIANAVVHDYGDVGIVVADITDRWVADSVQHEYVERVFDVWQRRPEGWRFIASSATKISSIP